MFLHRFNVSQAHIPSSNSHYPRGIPPNFFQQIHNLGIIITVAGHTISHTALRTWEWPMRQLTSQDENAGLRHRARAHTKVTNNFEKKWICLISNNTLASESQDKTNFGAEQLPRPSPKHTHTHTHKHKSNHNDPSRSVTHTSRIQSEVATVQYFKGGSCVRWSVDRYRREAV